MNVTKNLSLMAVAGFVFAAVVSSSAAEKRGDLVGHWKLRGDAKDESGQGNNAVNHGVRLKDGDFDGRTAHLEVAPSESLRFGTGDFSFSLWIHTEAQVDDAIGDILELYDPARRRGITLSVNSSASGYSSQSNDRHVYFGIDNAKLGEWEDCGRPSPTSPYICNSMIVFQGHLYAANSEGKSEADWAHVYRYAGGKKWIDCGRVGNQRATGVGSMIVHKGELYAVTSTYDWTRVQRGQFDPGHLYRYAGGTRWVDLGAPNPENRTLNTASSYGGKIYVGGGPKIWGVSVSDGDGNWRESVRFDKGGPRRCFPHTTTRYNGVLYVAYPSVHAYDGVEWKYAGVPAEPEAKLQTHCFAVFRGSLTAGTWPLAQVARYLGGEKWEELGRVGVDGTEVNSLVVYNGKLYGGSIPRSEVCRYDDQPQWTSLRRLYGGKDWVPAPPIENGGNPTDAELREWSRVTSMTIHRGRLFASTGNCTSSVKDSPADIRGSVLSIEAGKCVSYDEELQPGWRHLTAVRDGGRLKLYVDGKLAAESARFAAADYDLSTDQPLRIGFGQTDYFHGKMADVRAYRRALSVREIRKLASERPE